MVKSTTLLTCVLNWNKPVRSFVDIRIQKSCLLPSRSGALRSPYSDLSGCLPLPSGTASSGNLPWRVIAWERSRCITVGAAKPSCLDPNSRRCVPIHRGAGISTGVRLPATCGMGMCPYPIQFIWEYASSCRVPGSRFPPMTHQGVCLWPSRIGRRVRLRCRSRSPTFPMQQQRTRSIVCCARRWAGR